MTNDVPSPGGWLRLLNARVAVKVVIGLLAANGAVDAGQGVLDVYGRLQGAQASYFIEATLVSATKDTVTYSGLNPLPENVTGALLPSPDNLIFINANTAPATRLNIGTASEADEAITSTAGSANIASGLVLGGAKRVLNLANTGALTAQNSHGITPVVILPRNYTGENRINFTFTRGSGATANGEAPAFARFEIVPCNLEGVGC